MKNNLMSLQTQLYAGDIKGLAYVKDSNGRSDNVKLYVAAAINTEDNTCKVYYTVSVFNSFRKASPDSFNKTFDVYKDAVACYNDLCLKFKP